LLKQAQLDAARRHLRQLERQLREADDLDTSSFPRARALFEEAKQVGLIDERRTASSYEVMMTVLQDATRDDVIRDEMIVGDGADALAALRVERQGLRAELEAVKAEIRSTRLFNSESTGYETGGEGATRPT